MDNNEIVKTPSEKRKEMPKNLNEAMFNALENLGVTIIPLAAGQLSCIFYNTNDIYYAYKSSYKYAELLPGLPSNFAPVVLPEIFIECEWPNKPKESEYEEIIKKLLAKFKESLCSYNLVACRGVFMAPLAPGLESYTINTIVSVIQVLSTPTS